uniref:Uncharacterized protein n=1 Tax=Ixodes ricinus TaxID=34613 RepID=A0A0K8RAZ8_IXORI
MDYFDCTYVNGPFPLCFCSFCGGTQSEFFPLPDCPPTTTGVPPVCWNMYDATLQDKYRTNNTCEGWNTGFQKFIGHANTSVCRLIECLQQNHALVATALIQAQRGEPPQKCLRKTILRLQNHLKIIFEGF